MKKKTKKVYCKFCIYYAIVNPGALLETSAQDACTHRNNTRTRKVLSSSYEPTHMVICGYNRAAHEINDNNQCEWYKKR